MRCDIDYPFVTNSSRGLINKYPLELYEILGDYAEKIDKMDINDAEFIGNLYVELKTFLEHLEIDRLMDYLNIKLQPIVLFENKSNNKYFNIALYYMPYPRFYIISIIILFKNFFNKCIIYIMSKKQINPYHDKELKMVNFVKSQVNKDVRKKYKDW